ncbi:hypothetical protein APHCR_0019 [Anaplasma phagocytophilum str. CR1007]|nr:hypothetical protein APHCR_0019 [Anaplasma phagocytophilum str. CR1007]
MSSVSGILGSNAYVATEGGVSATWDLYGCRIGMYSVLSCLSTGKCLGQT